MRMKVPKSPYLEGFILKIVISEQFLRMNISIGCACRIEPKDFFCTKKDTHFTGQPLFSQILKLVDKSNIVRISKNGNHERYTKRLDGNHSTERIY